MNCVIFGAGPVSDYKAIRALLPKEPFSIIAADGGLRHTNALGLTQAEAASMLADPLMVLVNHTNT